MITQHTERVYLPVVGRWVEVPVESLPAEPPPRRRQQGRCEACGRLTPRDPWGRYLPVCDERCAAKAGWFRGRHHGWLPTEAAIRKGCERVQAGWTAAEELRRRHGNGPVDVLLEQHGWTPPRCQVLADGAVGGD